MAGCMRSTRLAARKCSIGYNAGAAMLDKFEDSRLVSYYFTVQCGRFALFCKGNAVVC